MRRRHRSILRPLTFLVALVNVWPAAAHDHIDIGIGFGDCCWHSRGWGYPYYPGYYPYPGYAYPPSSVVYAAPPVSYIPPPQVNVLGTTHANQTSPTFVDGFGRTCRQFEATSAGPAYGTACLQSDGSWRTAP